VTESCILNETAKAFGIHNWPVAAIKCYVGHSMAVASGDQLANTLGVWQYGIIPGIATIDAVADDVLASHLRLSPSHLDCGVGNLDAAFINAKGFGGNNATALALAPHVAAQLLERKHGVKHMAAWRQKVEKTRAQAAAYDRDVTAGNAEVIYRFDHEVRGAEHIHITHNALWIDGYRQAVPLDIPNPLGIHLT
jgi:acetoacetyl-[acyl-carrier protein] synthase